MQLTEMDVVTDSNNSVAIMVCISWQCISLLMRCMINHVSVIVGRNANNCARVFPTILG